MTATRRLAAILAADVAGYSRLIGADEGGTLERLRALRRQLLDPKIAEHHGRLVKTTGDGLLVEFGSVVDALRCAIEIQREMAGRNAGVPSDSCIEFRIGINVGDIVVEDGDIFGDGVNVASVVPAVGRPPAPSGRKATKAVKKVAKKRRPMSPEARARLLQNLVKARAARAKKQKAAKRSATKSAVKKSAKKTRKASKKKNMNM